MGIELVVMQIFPDKIERLMIKNIPTWVNVWFSLHMILLASALSLAVYFLRSNSDKRVWEYEARSKARREFIFNMSHEIRTPVTTIMGMDELILREAENEQINEYAANIQSSCKSLLGFLNDILDYSKIESDDMELCLSKYSVGRLITDCYNSVVQLADAKGIKLALAIDSTIPKELVGDESRIRQIIMNLLSNAVKFTKEGTVIFRVSANPLDSRTLELVTSIEDSGVGIAEEDRDRLFKAFAKTGNDKNGGTGLGLTIVDHLTRIMGGSISVNSKVNRGSIFTVILPQEIVSKEPLGDIYKYIDENTNIKKGYEAKFEAPKASVLVVDDVKINLMVITSLLKSTKVAISTAKNGKEAIEMCKKKHFDLILMDHLMPNLDGIETLSIIRESVMDGQNSDTPAIALTANVGYGNREDYIKAGFTDYLPKPVSGADLEEKLLKYLPKKLISKRSV
ncbi:MAG: response regulator [Lachnospiraceae bacterium]|nr:response regulator [Lachnospiraceae bacterium]